MAIFVIFLQREYHGVVWLVFNVMADTVMICGETLFRTEEQI